MAQTNFVITNATDLANDIRAIDQTGSDAATDTAYSFTFDLSGGSDTLALASQLDAINLATGSSLTILGEGDTIDGGGSINGFFVYGGEVTIESLTIADAKAEGGAGGSASGGAGGGGAGLAGGLFIAANAGVTLESVAFVNDAASGGAGGVGGGNSGGSAGGGGGLGGSGGRGAEYSAGGGGIGDGASGGSGVSGNGQPGIVPGAGGGAAGVGGAPGAGGASGGGGGSGFSQGGGGGVLAPGASGGSAGFGGGGGGWYGDYSLPVGGFGGGGGGAVYAGGYAGKGGFGGGGGGSAADNASSGGFGGGNGSGADGGGGLGAGGDIFIQQGGALLIEGGSLGAGTVEGGAGGSADAGSGEGLGSGLFIQGNQSVTLEPSVGQTLEIAGVIADETGSGGGISNPGAGTLDIDGAGTVRLDAANTYTGGTSLGSGTLDLSNALGAGGSAISFAGSSAATLKIEAGDAPANTIGGFLPGETIDLAGIGLATGVTLGAGNTLVVSGGTGGPVTLHLDASQSFAGMSFQLANDSGDGTDVVLSQPSLTQPTLNLTVAEGQSLGNLWSELVANGVDPQAPRLTISAIGTSGTQGFVSLDTGTQNLTYIATGLNPSEPVDAFTYTLSDGSGGIATGSVDVTVTGPNVPTTVATTPGSTTTATGAGQRLISEGSGQTLVGSSAGGDELFGGTDTNITAFGNGNSIFVEPGNHFIAMGGSNNSATLYDGNDTVSATGTGNTVTGGDGNDIITGMQGNSTINLGNGDNTISISGANNNITVGGGNNNIRAGTGGDETVTAGGGANTISAGGPTDSITVGNGANEIIATGASATITAGNGGDTIAASGAGDDITTGSGNDTIVDTVGLATIRAGLGTNTIKFAGSANDVINQGGTDTLTDSGTNNTIVLPDAGHGLDTINGAVLTNGDAFDLRAALAATTWDQQMSDLGDYLTLGTSGSNALVEISATSGGTPITVGILDGQGAVSLSSFVAHALLT